MKSPGPTYLFVTLRDKAAAKRFFKRVLAACPEVPKKIVTDQLRSYPATKAELPRAGEREARIRQSPRACEQPGRKQSPAHA